MMEFRKSTCNIKRDYEAFQTICSKISAHTYNKETNM